MPALYDCSVEADLLRGIRLARQSIARGELIVIPTDTVYGVAADAFSPQAVQRILDAKGRTRSTPPPVLIPGLSALDGLADDIPDEARRLAEAFWPGGLTIILYTQPSLTWDLGDTRGTVALRVPSHPIALAVLEDTGPLAVTSANRTGELAAETAAAARDMLGDAVAVYLDAGPVGEGYPAIGERPGERSSTIVDATGFASTGRFRIVRAGVISRERIADVVGADALA